MEYGLVVTDVKMKIKDGNGMKAICNIVVNGMLALNDIRIVENRSGKLMVAMPSKKMGDGRFKDLANPVNAEARRIIEDAVIGEYNKLTSLSNELFALIG
ncbi:SpoVG family protein [Bacillus cereus group sp. TH204-1LC]|uniref:SpoVG family protein n=1 Tax=Bacillus cereus group TaxID=86661 RepID=UPI0018F6B600|nr:MULTISPECIES: SpoVG family protein [Bacillus cereus group]MBJ8109108.1 SpoVG family protein [Bacillus cereus group sp. N6]MDA1616386.1 SpoVG family protein [Bacillus cereus group sp. TH204-1LC]MEC4620868.1 SpoVG family protein [Bacillus paranthracis]